jgi:segregation and condensation protein B
MYLCDRKRIQLMNDLVEPGDMPVDPPFQPPSMDEQERMVEAMLFATSDPLSVAEMAARMPLGCDPAEAVIRVRNCYKGRGVQVVRVGDKWAMRTASGYAHLMRNETTTTKKLSRAATETLAIIAYHQPATRAEIEEIRGVSVSRGTIDQLLELDWIRLGRRKMTPGRPVTFVVTNGFLDHFGLESTRDLPGLKELRAAGLLEPVQRPDPGGPDNAVSSKNDISSDRLGRTNGPDGLAAIGRGTGVDIDEEEAPGQTELFED